MYDLVIIGYGPGGYSASLLALRKGLNIAIVEESKLGGNCLNRACIPTKYYWTGAKFIEKLDVLSNYGIFIDKNKIDFKQAFEKKNEAIKYLRKSLRQLLKSKKVNVYKGKGKIIDKNKILVVDKDGNQSIVEAKNIIIATGSKPNSVGNLKLDNKYIMSTDFLLEKLDNLPKSVLIVGGGVAGCELGYILNKYGVNVYIVELKDRLLPSRDVSKDISRHLLRKFKKLGIKTFFNTTIEDYKIENGFIDVKLSNGENLKVGKIVLSVGRVPNSDNIDEIGIEKDNKGFIKVNQFLQTNYSNIYAIGDVIKSPMLAYTSSMEGEIAVKNILGEKIQPSYEYIPYAIFSAYEIAYIGLNEETAKEKGINITYGMYSYSFNEKAVDESDTDGFIKLFFDKSDKRFLGGYIMGSFASELMHLLEIALRESYTAEQLHNLIYFHPSITEIIPFASYDVAEGKLF
ncbi:MAG: pyridine nucleotide-disulfide oxidoreductase [Persephonella sp.]|nr:MAG: pyridine nucleotide-disulfide oxidoreductase [Persephonella sp.]RUM60369.1 MAG: pyridine nucleotide-disulfide oxidoreductase [Persephonella sp.]